MKDAKFENETGEKQSFREEAEHSAQSAKIRDAKTWKKERCHRGMNRKKSKTQRKKAKNVRAKYDYNAKEYQIKS